MKNLPVNTFRQYDIRGIADKEFTDDFVYHLGRAFSTLMQKENKVCVSVGYDMRPSSERIQKQLIRGLLDGGLSVTDLGMIPTPLLYFSVSHLKLDAGICITGSHNPIEYNGFKIHLQDRPFYGEEIQNLRRCMESESYHEGHGLCASQDIKPIYSDYVKKLFCFPKPLKVVVDCGHGMGSVVAPELFKSMGVDVIELYSNLDPNFPDHHPDPADPENLIDVQKKVLATHADMGVAYDGDADRIGLIDEQGNNIPGDKILLLCAREILKRKPGSVIIGDVKCSQSVYEALEKCGADAVMWKTGHSLVKAKMKETKAELAGELSGHIFFKDGWFGFDDAIYATCRVMDILAKDPRPLSEHLLDLPALAATPELHFECTDENKFEIVERVASHFKKTHDVIEIDGARILFEKGWGLVRASNTQPVLVMRFEAENEVALKAIQKEIETIVKQVSEAI